MPKTEVMGTLRDGRVVWTLGQEHFAETRTTRHEFLVQIIGLQRRQRTDHLVSYVKLLQKAPNQNVKITIRERYIIFAGAVQRLANRLSD